MLKNLGNADRVIRLLAGIVIFVLVFAGILTGTAAIILGIAAAILILTSIVSFCPIYYALKLSTCKNTKTPAEVK